MAAHCYAVEIDVTIGAEAWGEIAMFFCMRAERRAAGNLAVLAASAGAAAGGRPSALVTSRRSVPAEMMFNIFDIMDVSTYFRGARALFLND